MPTFESRWSNINKLFWHRKALSNCLSFFDHIYWKIQGLSGGWPERSWRLTCNQCALLKYSNSHWKFSKKIGNRIGWLIAIEDLLDNKELFVSTPKSVHLKSRKFSKLACTSVMHFSQILVRCHSLRNLLSYVKVQSNLQKN